MADAGRNRFRSTLRFNARTLTVVGTFRSRFRKRPMQHTTQIRIQAISIAVAIFAAGTSIPAQDRAKPAPTHADYQYGPHERHVFDFWQAESVGPTPVVVYIHGGGFRNGGKETIKRNDLRKLLDAGISVAAFNYRFVTQVPLPAAHHDCRRALQTLRSKADEWNIDRSRIGAYGGSAGAQLCMYLGFHDDMAKPDSDDPIARESTRLRCIATNGGQTTMDFQWWMDHVPGYDKPHRDVSEYFGVLDRGEYLKVVSNVSALSLISADDPPIDMKYRMSPEDPVPDGEGARSWKVHHVSFGLALKRKMDELGLESHVDYPGGPQTPYDGLVGIFLEKLAGDALAGQ